MGLQCNQQSAFVWKHGACSCTCHECLWTPFMSLFDGRLIIQAGMQPQGPDGSIRDSFSL